MNTLVIGPAGAGKTTLIERAFADRDCYILDVADFLGPPFPDPDDRRAFVGAYRRLAGVISNHPEDAPLVVEVCPDYPGEALPAIVEALKEKERPTQVTPVWAPRRACVKNNLSRERVAPRKLINRQHRVPLGALTERLIGAFEGR